MAAADSSNPGNPDNRGPEEEFLESGGIGSDGVDLNDTANAKQPIDNPHWLKEHAGVEEILLAALVAFFLAQRKRIKAALKSHDVYDTSTISEVYREEEEYDLFIEAITPALMAGMAAGAAMLLRLLPASVRPGTSATAQPAASSAVDEEKPLPQSILNQIKALFDEWIAAAYFAAIISSTREALEATIADGIANGDKNTEIKKAVSKALGEATGKGRAADIATTEATGALNAGVVAAILDLEAIGTAEGKVWYTVGDHKVRDTHRALDGTMASVKGLFNVGGELAPWPGHWSLSPGERCGCRCGLLVVAVSNTTGSEE